MAETSISLIDDIVATLDEESSLAYKNGDAEKKAFIVSSQLASILESQNRENLFLVTLTGYNEKDIKKIFTAQNAKLKFLKDFDNHAVNTDLANIFDIQQKLQNSDDFIELNTKLPQGEKLFCIVRGPTDKTITIGNKYSNNNKSIDFSNFIIVGDFNSGKQDAQDAIKLLPYAVIGKLIISSWDKEVFSKINVLPYAEIIDCSFSINDLNDLSGKLPNGIQTLIVQETLIKPNSLKDTNKLESAKNFRKQYPNIIVTDAKGKYILPLDLDTPQPPKDIEKERKTNKKTNPAVQKPTQEPDTNGMLSMTKAYEQFIEKNGLSKESLSRGDFAKFIKKEFPGKIVPVIIKGQKQNYIKNVDYNDIEHALLQDIEKRHEKLNATQPEVPVQTPGKQPQNTVQQETTDTTSQPERPIGTEYKILTFIPKDIWKELSPTEQQELEKYFNLFNVWSQPTNNHPCIYFDESGHKQTLSKLTCKNKQTFSYGGKATQKGNQRVVFKTITLVDENGDIKKDENGNPTYIIVAYKYFAQHNREYTDSLKHTICISDHELTDNTYKNMKTKEGGVQKFYTLDELRKKSEKTFEYNPNAPFADKAKEEETQTPPQQEPGTSKDSTKPQETPTQVVSKPTEDSTNAWKPAFVGTDDPHKENEKPAEQPLNTEENIVKPEKTTSGGELWTLQELADKIDITREQLKTIKQHMPSDWFCGQTRAMRFKAINWNELQEWLKQNDPHKPKIGTKKPNIPVAPNETQSSTSNDNGLVALMALEKRVNKLLEILTTLKEELQANQDKVNNITKQIKQKAQQGEFDTVQELASKANTAKQATQQTESKIKKAEQKLASVKDKFETGQKLIAQRNTARSEKEAAQKALQEKEQSLKDADDAIKRFFDGIGSHDE